MCLPPTNRFRLFWFNLLRNKVYRVFYALLIIVTMVTMAMQHPLNDPTLEYEVVLYRFDIATTAIFILEIPIKIIATGLLLNGKRSYLRSVWNVMELLSVIFTIIAIVPIP
jgi:hypothetical protein